MPYPGAVCPGSRPHAGTGCTPAGARECTGSGGRATDSARADPGPRGGASPGSSQAGPRASPSPRACSAEASGTAPAEARPCLSCPGHDQEKGCGS